MNHDDFEPEEDMRPGQREIDALLDGEPVDRDALRVALADAAARDYLIDTLALRQLTREMGPTHFVPAATPARGGMRQVRWVAAALVLMTSVAGAYLSGQRSIMWEDIDLPRVASSDMVGTAEPRSVAPDNLSPPREPTRVIRFEPGVNWTEPKWSR